MFSQICSCLKRTRPTILAIATIACSTVAFTTNFSITTSDSNKPISPYIYGTNQGLTGKENFSGFRQGGNRMTGYNWENNASNAGSDYIHSSDNYIPSSMGIPNSQATVPGIAVTAFIDSCRKKSQFSLITMQMAGYVAHDKNGKIDTTETAPSARWREVLPKKPTAFSPIPDTTDNAVYMDELLNFLKTKYAAASDSWLGGICLDNEPALWVSTHPRIHVKKPTCQELLDKSVALSSAIKNIDTKPLVFGPVTYGFGEMIDFQGASDWKTVKGTSSWFVDWYLSKFKAASESASKRLLDVFDLHWYPEAQGNNERIVFNINPTNRANAEARLQAPRSLWDSRYKENSWVAQSYSSYLPIIPKVKASIDANYPGTKLSISEYNYGGENHISGGLATADVLGIFGKYGVDYGFYWQMENTPNFTSAAFRLFRNYDGNKGTFGATSVAAQTTDSVKSSIYASVVSASNAELHLIVLNKNYDSTMNASITINSQVTYEAVRIWSFDSSSSSIQERIPAPTISNNTFSYSIPRLTACHVVLKPSTGTQKNQLSNLTSGNTASVELHDNTIRYAFPADDIGTISLFGLNGVLIRQWKSVTGTGTFLFNPGSPEHAAKNVILLWESKKGNGAKRVLLTK